MSSFFLHFSFCRYWILGTLVLPVILYYWYLWLDARYVGQAAVTIVKKMLLDQFVISPPILITFYTLMSLMEGREDLTKELRSIVTVDFCKILTGPEHNPIYSVILTLIPMT